MKKHYLVLLAFAFPFVATAQVTNAENYTPGDQIHNMTCSVPSPGGSGTAQTWNFAGVADSGQATTWVFDDTSSADPNDIITAPTPANAGTPVHKTASQNLLLSAGGAMGVTYTPGLLLAERSFNYGTTDNVPFTAAGFANGGGSVSVNVDGSGTLTTPAGSYPNAYRMVMHHDEVDSVLILTISYLNTHNVSYVWYDASHTAPLFRIDSNYVSGTGTLVFLNDTSATAQYLQKVFPAAVNNVSSAAQNASVNFNGNNLTVNASLKNGQQYDLNVFNISGQKVYSNNFTATGSVEHFNLNNELAAGTYIIGIYEKNSTAAPIIIKSVKE